MLVGILIHVDIPYLLLPVFQNGWTPIMQASQDGDVEMVKILTSADSLEINHASKVQ